MLTPIIKEQRFRATFTFIVAGTDADWIDVTPIILGLRMHVRVAVDSDVEACRIFAFTRLARPSMLIAPCTLVFVVCTGSC